MAERVLPPLAARLKELRVAAGMSQQSLAVAAGLSVSLVSQIEQGSRSDPRISTTTALAKALGVTLDELMVEVRLVARSVRSTVGERPSVGR